MILSQKNPKQIWVHFFFLDIVLGQLDDKAKYFGKLLGKLNSYHHQVGGEVYAVDESTLYIKDFIYDGLGQDTFFFAGGTNRPGSQGFIIPNEFGRYVIGIQKYKLLILKMYGSNCSLD